MCKYGEIPCIGSGGIVGTVCHAKANVSEVRTDTNMSQLVLGGVGT